jgi:hypothetical protein
MPHLKLDGLAQHHLVEGADEEPVQQFPVEDSHTRNSSCTQTTKIVYQPQSFLTSTIRSLYIGTKTIFYPSLCLESSRDTPKFTPHARFLALFLPL